MTAIALRRDDGRLALAALVFGALVIGTTPILVRLATCGPAAAGFWRLAFATPLLAAMAARARPVGLGAPSRAMLLAGLAFALDLGCWHYGIRYTSVANATVLPNLTPVVVTIAGWLFFKERPRPVFLLGMAAAIGGAILMAEAAPVGARAGASPHLGDVLSASTALWYALYFLAVRAARQTHSTTRVMLWSCLVGAPLLMATALAMGEQILPGTPLGWAAMAGLGLAHVFGQGSIAWALGRLPTSTASVTVLVQPVAAAALAYLIFGESLTLLQAAGAAIALVGVVAAQQAPAKAAVT
ncbi:MAG TPA: EamA family transporter [Caulobacteraceae bacterium]|jgi:drug/metabolite transporter (DMT)-like permease|nr:EamA family transporter [Caulobacteraceae bacterium]